MKEAPMQLSNDGQPLNTRRAAAAYIGWFFTVLILFGLSAGLVWANQHRIQGQVVTLQRTADLGPRVLVTPVQGAVGNRQIPFPASVHGYIETPIYAKTAGYLKAIHVDKGDRVRMGEVLAILESPELDKQVADAKANYWLQKVTDARNQQLVAEEVIPQQTADDSHAALLQANAAYQQLVALQSLRDYQGSNRRRHHRAIC